MAQVSDGGYQLVIRSGVDGLECLWDDWTALVSALERPTPAHHPQWYEAFFTRADTTDPRIDFLAIYHGHRLAAVFPVGLRTSGRLRARHLCMPPGVELDILPDAVVAAGESPAAVFEFLVSALQRHPPYRWDSLRARRVLEDSHLARCLADRALSKAVRQVAGACCVIRVDHTHKRVPLSKKFRASLRNARNRLQADGPMEFTCHSYPASVDQAFDVYVALEASGWKAHQDHGKDDYSPGSALTLNPAKLGFYRHLVQAFSRNGQAHIYQLDVGGTAIAAQIALVLDDVCYLLKTAYSQAHARLSPGHLLLERVIGHHTGRSDIALINFISDYAWLDRWRPERWRYHSYEYFNSTLKGRIHRSRRRWAARG